jgi:hypothetical protein
MCNKKFLKINIIKIKDPELSVRNTGFSKGSGTAGEKYRNPQKDPTGPPLFRKTKNHKCCFPILQRTKTETAVSA